LVAVCLMIITAQSSYSYASFDDANDSNEQHALGISSSFGKWTGGVVPWVYNATDAPTGYTDDNTTAALFQAAIDEWKGLCDVTFVYGGVDNNADISDSSDGVVVFEWAPLGGAAGRAGPTNSSATETTLGRWNYVDGTLEMDPNVFAFPGGTVSEQERNRLAFYSTVVHELGHLIGLGHSDRPDSIMYADPYNSITHTMEDDIQACRSLYGYSDVHDPAVVYLPPAVGTNTYDFLFLAEFSDVTNTPITSDDGSPPADSETLALRWQTTTPPYPKTITMAVVDPLGYLATTDETEITTASVGKFGVQSFRRLRENPGNWTVYVYDGTGLVATLPFAVNTSLPVVNQAPEATFEFSENPATRLTSLTTTVASDAENDNATVIWHIPGQSPTTFTPISLPASDVKNNVDLDNQLVNEIFVEVNDDASRYTGTDPGTGPAGSGFHRLFRYNSSNRNLGSDLNGDNSSDILWRNASSGLNWLYTLAGNYIQLSVGINTVNTLWEIVGTGDYNGDGKSDLLWRNSVTGQNWMYLMDGAAIVSSVGINTVSDTNWQVVASGDYNGDGQSDIFWRNTSTGQNWMYLMNGATIATNVGINYAAPVWSVAGSGDYDGDGNSDVLWRNSSTGENWMYLMNGATISTSVALNSAATSWQVVGNGDYNGDGNSDILWRNSSSGLNWMYLMNGTSISSSAAVNTVPTVWDIVGSGDYNGDGNSDILWRNSGNGDNWMYQMNGPAILNSVVIDRVTSSQWQVVDRN